jgi:DNA-directed RNA polymerase specialized sigma24 family protein
VLSRLTRMQREALLLVAIGLTQEEAAEVMGVCTHAVTHRLGRARQRILGERESGADPAACHHAIVP